MTYTEKLYFVELISITKEENGTVWKATYALKENPAPLIFFLCVYYRRFVVWWTGRYIGKVMKFCENVYISSN